MPFNIHSIYRPIAKIWRRQRFQLFLDYIRPQSTDRMIDVGGYPGFWTAYPMPVERIDSLNVHEVSWDSTAFPGHNIQVLLGDGCALTMPDKAYDIGYSNSVIEHVGTWEQQQKFASEIRRVAGKIWVQTPAYECPIEPHYLTPFVHYFPRWLRRRTVRWFTVWGWIEKPSQEQVDMMVDTTRLLRKSEMQHLFPDCEIYTERMLGVIPKSYVAIRRNG